MLSIIKGLLQKCIKDIDAGNSNLTEEECLDVISYLKDITTKDKKISKYQACKYLGISRATFDKYIREGILPKGNKEAGFKELFWTRKDLDNFLFKNK